MDWNRDGHLDILSGCYWTDNADGGHIQMLAGNGSLDFSAAEAITNVAGKPLENIELQKSNGQTPDNIIQNICTQQHAIDYDDDGDLDLVVGCFGPEFFLYENKGTVDKPELTERPVKLDVTSPSHHAAPHLVDWDGDGDLDLLSGTSDGGVIYSENTGTRASPKWSEFKQLIAAGDSAFQASNGEAASEQGSTGPSVNTRVWATDFNADGRLDLLVGDQVTINRRVPGLTDEEYDEKVKLANEAMEGLREYSERLSELYTKIQEQAGSDTTADDEPADASDSADENAAEEQPDAATDAQQGSSKNLQEELESLSQEYSSAYAKYRELHDAYETNEMTGHVWLYLQKAP
ncbi:MAG: FG-GAP-like repeat-containing protein [Pirellulaceae bacterium]|nr:VCBS repeat-containing protein [Planctomycetales bacterium]